MRIWLIKEGEPLPIDESPRLMRTASLAKYLSEHGHTVTWWTSSYLHQKKEYICNEYKIYLINENEKLICLHSKFSYKKNISLKRILYHRDLGRQLAKHIYNEPKPDIILCSWPLAEFASEAVKFGKENHIPVILDARDQWPDIFVRAFPDRFQRIGEIIIKPLKNRAGFLFNSADGITAMADSVLEWACAYAGHRPSDKDKTIYIGNSRMTISEQQFIDACEWWKNQGVTDSDWIICFFSTFGSHIAIDIVIKAVKELSENYPNIKLVLGGGGDREEEFKKIADRCPNVVFAGWLDSIKMTALMRIAKCGAFSIKNTFDFRDTFNNKAIQYISEGLPILNSLSGFAKRLIEEREMGLTYECSDIQDCKETILKFYNNEADRNNMGENALKCFYELFESNVVNQQFEDYLLQMYKLYNE